MWHTKDSTAASTLQAGGLHSWGLWSLHILLVYTSFITQPKNITLRCL